MFSYISQLAMISPPIYVCLLCCICYNLKVDRVDSPLACSSAIQHCSNDSAPSPSSLQSVISPFLDPLHFSSKLFLAYPRTICNFLLLTLILFIAQPCDFFFSGFCFLFFQISSLKKQTNKKKLFSGFVYTFFSVCSPV